MKKFIILLMILSMCMIQIACGNKEDVHKQVNEGQSTEKPIEKTNEQKSNSELQKDENADDADEGIKKESVSTEVESKTSKDIYGLIPREWKILEKVKGKPEIVEGDLNKDGISDIAAVIEGVSETEKSSSRALLIAFGNKDKTYTLSIIANKSILRVDLGGVWGDPLESISIDRGSVAITFYGGSNWRWYRTYRFRYQENNWYLIGATLGSYFDGKVTRENADEEDYNLLTGDYIVKKTNDNGNQITTKENRGKKALVNLKDFVVDSEDKQF